MGDTLAGMITGFLAQFPQLTLLQSSCYSLSGFTSAIADDLAKTPMVFTTHISKSHSSWMKSCQYNLKNVSCIEASFFRFRHFLSLLELICDKIKQNFYENIEEKVTSIFEKTQSKWEKRRQNEKKTSE